MMIAEATLRELREFCTNETTLQLTEQPKSLLVVGGGPIGLEFYCLAKLRTLGYEFEWRLV